MRVARLALANVRRIKVAELCFQPGFNVIAGVNGVGKTTVLDALAVCLSDVVGHVNELRRYRKPFTFDDIRIGADALDVFCDVEDMEGARYGNAFHRSHETNGPRKKARVASGWAGFAEEAPPSATGDEIGGRPLAILFSTNRSVPSERVPASSAAAGDVSVAFSGALSNRELRLGEFAAWMRSRQALGEEWPAARRVLEVFNSAVTRFLPGYRNLRPDERGRSLLVDRNDTTLPVKLLSGGELGVLAMVLDLTRRLAQANPKMEDPTAEAEAIILIDEIELHIHPRWQRQIVANLKRTFPKCQFIATTHSPQVIGEVEHDRIQIITDDQVYSPLHSFGVDSSRVLEEIMGADPRTRVVKELLSKISELIGDDHYGDAHALLVELSRRLGENDPEVTRVRTLLEFMADDE